MCYATDMRKAYIFLQKSLSNNYRVLQIDSYHFWHSQKLEVGFSPQRTNKSQDDLRSVSRTIPQKLAGLIPDTIRKTYEYS